MRRASRAAVLLAATAVATAGCSSGTSDRTASAGPSAPASSASAGGSGSPAPEASVSGGVTPSGAVTAGGGATIASKTGSAGNAPLRIDVLSLHRSEAVATLNFSVTNLSTETGSKWQVSTAFSAAGLSDPDAFSVDGVYLIDGKHSKKYLVARDSAGKCACSTGLSSTFVGAGQSAVLTASFASPPPDVGTVDVSVPSAGTFTNVPLG